MVVSVSRSVRFCPRVLVTAVHMVQVLEVIRSGPFDSPNFVSIFECFGGLGSCSGGLLRGVEGRGEMKREGWDVFTF